VEETGTVSMNANLTQIKMGLIRQHLSMFLLLYEPPTQTSPYPVANLIVNGFLNKGHLKEMKDPLKLPAMFYQKVRGWGKWVHRLVEHRTENECESSIPDREAWNGLRQSGGIKIRKTIIH